MASCDRCKRRTAYEPMVMTDDADLCVCCAAARIAELEAERDELRAVIDLMQPFDGHGCLDGDCPHDNMGECLMAIRTWMKEVGEAAEAAKAEQGRGDG